MDEPNGPPTAPPTTEPIVCNTSVAMKVSQGISECHSRRTEGPTGNPEPRQESLEFVLDSRSRAMRASGMTGMKHSISNTWKGESRREASAPMRPDGDFRDAGAGVRMDHMRC